MDAEQLAALLAQIENLELTVRAAGPSPLASDAIAAFVAGIGSPGTATNYRYVLTMLARTWPAVTLDQMTVNDLAQWRVQGISARTVRHYLSVLTGFVRFCLDSNWLLWTVREERRFNSLVSRTRRLVRPPRRLQKRPSEDVIGRLISEVYLQPEGVQILVWHRNIALIETLRCTGMRAAEAVGLTRGALGDMRARIIGKGNRERLVYWDYDAWVALRIYLAETPVSQSAPVFLRHGTDGNRPMSPSIVWHIVHDVARRAGVDFHPHLFRHYAISRMAEISVLAAREFAGHDDLTTTSVYAAGLDSETLATFRKAFLG